MVMKWARKSLSERKKKRIKGQLAQIQTINKRHITERREKDKVREQ